MVPKRAVANPVKKAKTAASGSPVKKPATTMSAKRQAAKKPTPTVATKGVTGKKSKLKAVPESSMPASKKRKVESEPFTAPRVLKKRKTEDPLNKVPSQKLKVYVFGSGESGELGLGHVTRNGKKPTDVKRPRLNDLLDVGTVGVVQIAVGGMHCVALTHDGKILTWGVNDNGALGRDTTWEAPTRDIDASESNDGSDSDSAGESGLSPKESTPTAIPAEFFSKGDGDLVQVAATDSASFVLTSKGLVYGWGTFSGSDGNIGFSRTVYKGTKSEIQTRPTLIPQLKNITSLAAGGNHMLALESYGAIYAWGCGQQSQLGRPIMESYRTAALIPSLVRIPRSKGQKSPITAIAAGQFHSFALTATGAVYAWGLNNFGQTGISPVPAGNDADDDDDSEQQGPESLILHKPTLVDSLAAYVGSEREHITALAGGNHHSLALTSAGHLLSWGRCDASQAGILLPSSSTSSSSDPTTSPSTSPLVPHSSLIFDSHSKPRILAQPTLIPTHFSPSSSTSSAPTRNSSNSNNSSPIIAIATGIDNSMTVTQDGKVYAWGFGASYRTGLGTEENVDLPTAVENSALRGQKIVWAGCGGQFGVFGAVRGGSDGE